MILLRMLNGKNYTIGILLTENGVYYTLEPPWLNNARNMSCIPRGLYDYEFLESSASGKYRNCLHIKNVPGRTGILMHAGNKPEDTKGCILPGKKLGVSGGTRAVWNSRVALNEIVGESKKGKLRVL